MRLFELIIHILLAFLMLNIMIFGKRSLGWILSGLNVTAMILHLVIEGTRTHMIPALILCGVFTILQIAECNGLFLIIHRIKKLSRVKAICIGSILGLVILISVTVNQIFEINHLPKPTGDYTVGIIELQLTDDSREEVFTAEEGDKRIVPVCIWYPAEKTTRIKPLKYIEDWESCDDLRKTNSLPFPIDQVLHINTWSYPNVPFIRNGKSYPVILFSHGHGGYLRQNSL